MTCQICQMEESMWSWHPFGPAEDADCFLGARSSYRGFPVLQVGDTCYRHIKAGRPYTFSYRGKTYRGTLHERPQEIAEEDTEQR